MNVQEIRRRYDAVVQSGDHALMVAEQGGRIIALCHTYARPALDKPPEAVVQALVVDQASRRQRGGQDHHDSSRDVGGRSRFYIRYPRVPRVTIRRPCLLRIYRFAYENFRSLIKHKQEWMAANFAPGYFSQLNGDQQTLHSIIGGYSLSNAKYIDTDGLDTVLDDLYLKVNACLLNGGKAVGSVSVTVHTKKSGIEVPNLRVVCMAKILRLYHNYSPTPFPQLSSPTKWELPPGNYIMWTENPETGQKSSTQEIPVDRNQECDLAVP